MLPRPLIFSTPFPPTLIALPFPPPFEINGTTKHFVSDFPDEDLLLCVSEWAMYDEGHGVGGEPRAIGGQDVGESHIRASGSANALKALLVARTVQTLSISLLSMTFLVQGCQKDKESALLHFFTQPHSCALALFLFGKFRPASPLPVTPASFHSQFKTVIPL